jgi:hypothetical protein
MACLNARQAPSGPYRLNFRIVIPGSMGRLAVRSCLLICCENAVQFNLLPRGRHFSCWHMFSQWPVSAHAARIARLCFSLPKGDDLLNHEFGVKKSDQPNTASDCFQTNALSRTPQPPCSPDLASAALSCWDASKSNDRDM